MRKAQSALEFLTTYGWAFLVILIMIGALAYFGILNPQRYLPDRCTVTPGFACEEFQLLRSGGNSITPTLIFKNGLGNSITAIDINFTSELGGNAVCQNDTIGVDETFGCTLVYTTVTSTPAAGAKQKITFTGNYTLAGKTLGQTMSGEVFGVLK